MADLIGTKAMARLAEVTPRAVRHARETGRLAVTGDGKYDPQHPLNAAWLRMRRARTAPGHRSRDLEAKFAAAVAKLRLAKDRYEAKREQYVDRDEAIRVAGEDADFVLAMLRAAPARHAAAFSERLGVDLATGRAILEQFIRLALVEIGDLKSEAIRAAEIA